MPAGAAVVIGAQQFNPSVVSQLWLVRHGLLGEDEFLPGCFFTDMFVQVQSRRFRLLVVPEQLQFIPAVPPAEEQALIVDKIGAIVGFLPHTPFKALGLNFAWHLVPREGDFIAFTRTLFASENRPLYRNFDTEDAQFGAYLSKNFLGFRLKLDVKPILVLLADRTENRLQFVFNFHADLGERPAEEIGQHLLRWNEVKAEAERIIESVEAREQQ
jgi:hypothetical protein